MTTDFWVHQWRLLQVAVQFLTRIPVASLPDFQTTWLSESLRYFPVVGVLVALLQWLLWSVLVVALPHAVALALTMGFGLLLTGGFHEDGWADVCDGMGGGYTPERVLTIMKDSRIGAFGGMGLVWILLTKWATLSYLAAGVAFGLCLLWAHSLSRLAATALIVSLNHVGDAEHSKTKPLGNQMNLTQWCVSASLCLGCLIPFSMGLMVLSGGPDLRSVLLAAVCALLAAGLVTALCARYFRRRIGGYTGDCLGATQQLVELSVYLAVLSVLGPVFVR